MSLPVFSGVAFQVQGASVDRNSLTLGGGVTAGQANAQVFAQYDAQVGHGPPIHQGDCGVRISW